MKSLNLSLMTIALALAITTFVSCKKEKAEPTPIVQEEVILGTWKGNYGAGKNEPSVYFSFVIAKDGTMKVFADKKDNSVGGTGTWTLNESVLSGKYKYTSGLVEYTINAKFDEQAKTLNGSWGIKDKESGTFSMTKQ